MSVPFSHTEKCKKFTALRQEVHDSWIARFPNYCKTCNSTGVITSPGDLVDYGSTRVHLPDDVDPCEDCTEQGKCPRCGEVVSYTDDFDKPAPCPHCGFKWGEDPDDFMPWLVEDCGCLDDWLDKREQEIEKDPFYFEED